MDNNSNPSDFGMSSGSLEEKRIEPDAHKSVVKRVGLGLIFQAKITKVLASAIAVVVAGLVGYSGTRYYLNKRPSKMSPTSTVSSHTSTDATIDAQALEDAASQVPVDTPAQNPSTTPVANTPIKVYCGVSGMPEAVCTAITSIEKEGLKNNKYVVADTSNLPDGTSVEVDEKSWVQPGPELGNVKFTAKYTTKTYSGTAFFQKSGDIWKIISYTLDKA